MLIVKGNYLRQNGCEYQTLECKRKIYHLHLDNFLPFKIMYYNSEIWHLQSLKMNLKQKLLSSSARAIKTCVKHCTNGYSYNKLHEVYNIATPENYLLYKHALCLFKLMNCNSLFSLEWVSLNFNQILTSRQTTFKSNKANSKRVGLNALANRLFILNGRIPLSWLNLSLDSFKLKCKKEFLLYNWKQIKFYMNSARMAQRNCKWISMCQ